MTPNEFVAFCIAQGNVERDSRDLFAEIIEAADDVDTCFHPSPDYLETHYVISAYIDKYQDDIKSLIDIQSDCGMGGLWMEAESLTNEFQSRYDGTNWGEELDWHDTLDQFLTEKLQ